MNSIGRATARVAAAALLVITVGGALVGSAFAQGPALDLHAAVARALEQNLQVTVTRANVRAAEAALQVARASLGPTVNLSAGGSITGSGSVTSGATSVSAGVSYLIYNGGVREAQIRQAEAKVESARATLEVIRSAVALEAVQAFLSVVTAGQTVTVQERAVASAQAQLDAARAQYAAGVAAQSDVLSGESRLASAQVNLVSARGQLENSRASLRVAVGLDPAAPVEIAAPQGPPAFEISEEDALRRAAERPEVRKAQADVRSNEAALAQAMSAAGITVTANGQYVLVQTGGSAGGWSAGISIAFPLYDGGAQRARVEAARADLEASKAEAARVNQQMRQEALRARLALLGANVRAEAAQRAQAAAVEALRAAEGRYRAGVGTILEVTSAQADAVAADLVVVQAAADRWTTLATLRRAVGMAVLP